MKKIFLPALAFCGVSVLSVAWANAGDEAQSPTAPVAPTVASPVAASVDNDGFRPSQFEGVSVRERPRSASTSTTSKSGKRGWMKILPGAASTRTADMPSKRGTVTHLKVSGGPGGGETIIISGTMHGSQARRGKDGRVTLQCVPGESLAAHRAHQAHRGHQGRKTVRKTASR
jgi:hypothetical protein